MKKHDKEILQNTLNNEKAVIKKLKTMYKQSLDDIIKKSNALQDQINNLQGYINTAVDAEEKAVFQSMQQSKIYQKQYQDALKKQIGAILDTMQVEEFKTISEHLQKSYTDGFVGVMYSLKEQGIPLIMPINQEAVVQAIQTDSKISQGLYKRLGEDVSALKKNIASEISRGIATGASYTQIAQQIKSQMVGIYDKKSGGALYRAETIARTEGNRISNTAAMDACTKAKEKGCDVVKQWDATLDGATRPSHRQVDGEIKELDKKFSNGLMRPLDNNAPAGEVVNCRCALLQRAKWALDEDELETLKERAEYFELDKTANFEDFKQKYLKAVENIENSSKMLSTEETVEKAKQYAKNLLKDSSLLEYDNGHPIVNYVNKQLGYDTLPQVLSAEEFDKQAQGKTLLFRGLEGNDKMFADEMAEAFKSGKFFCGRGIYGNGTYCTASKDIAEQYARSSDSVIMEMFLSDEAKVADFKTIFKEFEKTGIPKMIGHTEAYQEVIADVGTFAAIKGYDAIALNGFKDLDYIVLLNRGKAIVKE